MEPQGSKRAASASLPSGNRLGSARAEADSLMLERAFVETYDFRTLTTTQDFNFVVGRRGSGKTALYLKISELFRHRAGTLLHAVKTEEYEALELQSVIQHFAADYKAARSVSRIAWRVFLLLQSLRDLTGHWKADRAGEYEFLLRYRAKHGDLLSLPGIRSCSELIRRHATAATTLDQIPGAIATAMEIEHLQAAVDEGLKSVGLQPVFLFDALDEGWRHTTAAMSVVGGLGIAVADLADRHSCIYGVLFVRDNIFRALASLDPDFSRHIEGNTLRLRWDDSSLLHLASNRLRVSMNLPSGENDIRVWNRFAFRQLKDREGFQFCLRYTLLRPRDLLVLLNRAFQVAARQERSEIIEQDIESTAKEISQDRLTDLLKEYSEVFPGLDQFVALFKNRPAIEELEAVVNLLDSAADDNDFSLESSSDFAVLGSGDHIFRALYSVGFIGIEAKPGEYQFCHDGSRSEVDSSNRRLRTVIHPCYWKALDIAPGESNAELISDVHDDYKVNFNPETTEMRRRQIGQLVSELPRLPTGADGASAFEDWALRGVKVLFAGSLANPEFKPNGVAIQRRDIVATNMTIKGFWKRVYDDYESRQVIFEVKNYEELGADDFKQVLSYTSGSYGRLAIVITRQTTESPSNVERGWVRTLWHEHKRLVLILPAIFWSRCIQKLRSSKRHDYTEDQLNKRLDTYERSYIALHHDNVKSRRKNR